MSALRSKIADKNIVNLAKRSRNPEMAKAIKRTRARLNEGGRADFTADLLRQHAEVLGSLALVIPIAIVATAGAAMSIGFGMQALFWALLTLCAYTVLGVFARRLASTEIDVINIPYWSNIMLACHIVTGLCWAWLAARCSHSAGGSSRSEPSLFNRRPVMSTERKVAVITGASQGIRPPTDLIDATAPGN